VVGYVTRAPQSRIVAAIVAAIVICTAGAAAADTDYTPWPAWAPEVGFGGHVSRIGARSEGGVDGVLALAYGTGRWQLFGEATLGTAGFDNTATTPALDMRIDGSRTWFGGGVRWLARQFVVERELLVEMDLHAQSGIERYAFDDGSVLVRPDVAVGVGWDIRVPRIHQLTTRIEVRIVFAPNERAEIACRGSCVATGTAPGMDMGITFAW
jgi:hypothetical protein